MKDLNLNDFNMITGINESRTSTKQIPCECKCKFDEKVTQIKSKIAINSGVSAKIQKKVMCVKNYI